MQIHRLCLELTTSCNVRCKLCSTHQTKFSELNFNNFVNFLPAASFTKLEEITICGAVGEPTLHPQFDKLIDYITSNSETRILLFTNGSTKNKKWWVDLAGKLKKEDTVFFALDGLKDTHKLYRTSDFKEVFENMKAFSDAGGTASWQCILFQHNQHQIEEIKQLAKGIRVTLDLKESTHYNAVLEKPTLVLEEKLRICSESENQQEPLCSYEMFISASSYIEACPLLRVNREFLREAGKKIEPKYLIESFKYKLNIKDTTFDEVLNSDFYTWIENNRGSLDTCTRWCGSCSL